MACLSGRNRESNAAVVETPKRKPTIPARDVKNLLSHLYKPAIGDGEVKTNLSELIDLPGKDEKETQPFTDEEVAALWEAFGSGDTFIGYILPTGMMPRTVKCLKENIPKATDQGCWNKDQDAPGNSDHDSGLPYNRLLKAHASPGKKLTNE